jgi:molybdopterin molybdotransferase
VLSLDAAQAKLLGGVVPLPVETVPLDAAAGRWAAADVVATRTQPPFAASAMDGYAIRWTDLPGPWTVIGEAAAGRRFPGTVGAREAVRIFTGAPLPDSADTVVVQEDVEQNDGMLRLTGDGPSSLGSHVRTAGLDFAAGDTLVAAGERLTSARLALAASGGHAEVPVRRAPHVVLLETGDELVPPGTTPGPDQIVSANGVMLAALLRAEGCRVTDGGIVPDRADALDAALAKAGAADVIVTIGGASVGDHDLVLPALQRAGADIDFWKVAIKPGKPIMTGTLGGAHVVGLPGNPVSAFVCAQLFLLPLVRALQGAARPLPVTVEARTATALLANGPRRDHLRGVVAAGVVTVAERQDSSMLRLLAGANALLVRPEGASAVAAGEIVPVIPLDV